MADIISRLKLESGEFDSKIKRASQELTAYSQHCRKMGLEMGYANKDAKEFAKSLGSMQTTATTARGKVSELSDAFVNLKAMYNQMTDAEKQGQFGKNLAASLDQLKERTQQAKQELADITKELNGASNIGGGGGLFGGGKLDGMLQVFGGNLMTKGLELATSAVSSLASEIGGMITQGIEMAKQGEGIRIAFERLGRGDILDGLREATHGTVTDLELMKAAVKFNDFKLPVEELGTMLAFAQQKAKDTGQSVDYMVDSIVTGLGRKSLMILDNLGLSANEIKEKMKQTGDMTKAVGAIIREQMAKAGDYVETAADRAAQANVSLQNKMEELGRKFAPIEEASNQLWTSMKIGILDIIGGPLAKLLNGLTDAGRINNSMQKHGGNDRVSGQVQRYRVAKVNGSSYMANYIDQQNLKSYDDEINHLQFTIAAYGKGRDAVEKGNIARLKEELQGVKDLRAEYIKMRNEADRPSVINSPATTTTTTTKKTTKTKQTGKTSDQIIREQFAAQQRDSLAYSSSYKSTAVDQPSEIWKAITEGAKESKSSVDELTAALEALNKAEGVTVKGTNKDSKELGKNWQAAASAIQSVGSAMSQIEDPAAKVIGIVAQAIATVALAFAQSLKGSMTVWDYIAAAAAGTATMISTISAIHSATGYAEGGMIKGNSYSGDNLMAMGPNGSLIGLNAGELVLNKSQQNNLASQLQGGGMQGMNLTATIRGEQIRLALNNNGRRTGRGEYVQSNKR